MPWGGAALLFSLIAPDHANVNRGMFLVQWVSDAAAPLHGTLVDGTVGTR